MRRASAAAVALAGLALLAGGCGGGSGSLPVPTIGAASTRPAALTPPAGAVVDARQWGARDLALARKDGIATVTIVDAQGSGIGGLTVRVDGRAAAACGVGCYRAAAAAGPVAVAIGGKTWRFATPASAPSGRQLLAAATKAFSRLRSVALEQRLGSGRGTPLVASFLFVAPDRLRYSIEGGSQAIVIGARRWDRPSPSGRWAGSARSASTS